VGVANFLLHPIIISHGGLPLGIAVRAQACIEEDSGRS
jgi:hypothetical protein